MPVFFRKISIKMLNFLGQCHKIKRNQFGRERRIPKSRIARGDMLNVVLVEPEIPMNTGNIARTCAVTGCALHLIEPLGFDISDRSLKRAGLDYWHLLDVKVYHDLEDFFEKNRVEEMWCLTTKAPRPYTEVVFHDGCYLFFGKETRGLPEAFLRQHYEECLRIPMRPTLRSLNLSNSVAITVYEALRQLQFPGMQGCGSMLDKQEEMSNEL